MVTAAGVARNPYLATVSPRVCKCVNPSMELVRARKLENAVRVITGYWSVYVGFFGDQLMWLDWIVVDTRTGQVLWRNGRHTTKEENIRDLNAK